MILSQKAENRVTIQETAGTFAKRYDVIVVGLGTAGAVAAITCARRGLTVLGIERLRCMGGMSTAGSVFGCYFGSDGGIYEEIDAKAAALQNVVYATTNRHCAEGKKYVFEQEAVRASVDIWYEASFTGVFLDGKKVRGLRVFYQNAEIDIGCRVLIDATGDGYVCEMAGAGGTFGRVFDHAPLPFSSVKVEDLGGFVRNSYLDNGRCNQYCAEELSNAVIAATASNLKDTYMDDDKRLLYIAPVLGLREGRLAEGESVVRLSDFLAGRVTAQPVMYAYADVDKHGADTAFESETFQDWYVASNLGAVNISVPIPLGAFIPKGYCGLLVAGRGLSVDHDMANCVRMIRDMHKTGEVVGIAAWLSIKHNCKLQDVPYDEMQNTLQETGCFNRANNQGYKLDAPRLAHPPASITWFREPANIRAALSSEKPGIAIWSCKLLGEPIWDYLIAWLAEADVHLKKNSAIALGIMGKKEGLPVIREMIEEPDGFVLQDCRKNNQIRCVIAIYLAGKLKCVEMAGALMEIIHDADQYSKEIMQSGCEGVKTFATVRYMVLSHSVASLIKIGNSHCLVRKAVGETFQTALRKNVFAPAANGEKQLDASAMYDVVRHAAEMTLENWG